MNKTFASCQWIVLLVARILQNVTRALVPRQFEPLDRRTHERYAERIVYR